MGLERESAAALEPLLARAVGESDVAAEGSREIERILLATEERLEAIRADASRAAGELGSDTERRAREMALERRDRVARMRDELTASAAGLAVRFEAMLDMLEAAERELSRQAGEPEPVRDERERHWSRALRLTLRERQRVTFSEDVPPELREDLFPEPQPSPSADEPPPRPKRRRRWWRRWLREAA